MRSTLNSFLLDFGQCHPTNYGRIASVSLITGIHLNALEGALLEAAEIGSSEAWGGGINHIIECVFCRDDRARFRVYNRYETRDSRRNTPCI